MSQTYVSLLACGKFSLRPDPTEPPFLVHFVTFRPWKTPYMSLAASMTPRPPNLWIPRALIAESFFKTPIIDVSWLQTAKIKRSAEVRVPLPPAAIAHTYMQTIPSHVSASFAVIPTIRKMDINYLITLKTPPINQGYLPFPRHFRPFGKSVSTRLAAILREEKPARRSGSRFAIELMWRKQVIHLWRHDCARGR